MIGEDSNDDEFWSLLENPQKLQIISKSNPHTVNSNFSTLRMSEKERYENLITNIRESKEEELRNMQIKLTNIAKSEFNSKLFHIKQEFLKEYEKLKDTYSSSRSIIQGKDKKIEDLATTVIKQEAIIADTRIWVNKLLKSNKKPLNPEKGKQSINNENIFKEQISVLKEVCDGYKEDLARYKSANEKLIEENNSLKKSYDELETKLKNQSNEVFSKLLKEKNDIQAEFNLYKIESEKEIEVREMINNRHSKVISGLQEELKLTKTVIKSPRIHHRAAEKLKDLHKDYRTEESPLEIREVREIREEKIPRKVSKRSRFNRGSGCSYKDYKVVDVDSLRNEYYGLQTISRTSRLELIGQKSANLSCFIDSRKKLSKNSLYWKED